MSQGNSNLRSLLYKNYSLSEETLGYVTSSDPTNTDKRFLVAGSKNVLINYQKKVQTRGGYTRLGAGNTSLFNIRNAWTWNTSTASQIPQRFYNQSLQVYLQKLDGTTINAWTTIFSSWSATAMLRAALGYFDSTEKIDFQLMVNGDANVYMWAGGMALAASVSALSIVEAGDTSNELASWAISGLNATNSNGGVLYWKLTNSVSTRTVQIYKDSGGTSLVASGSRSGDGSITLTAQNGSGLSGSVVVTYSGDETTVASQTLTCTYTVTKAGTTTWSQNRFMNTLSGRSIVNVATGTVYTYTGGEGSATLTGVVPATGTMDIAATNLIVQNIVTSSNAPASGRTNDVPFVFQNQLHLGSYNDNVVYISSNSNYASYSFSAPRLPGEGAKLNLDSPCRAINTISKTLVVFAGKSSLYKTVYNSITVGSTLAETLDVNRFDTGINQGALNHESVVPIGNSLAYLTNEVTLRLINSPDTLTGIDPETYSNPIKPDFDSETWPNAFGMWFKNILFFSAPGGSHLFMLNFVEDSNGKLFRFWNPPQTFPIGPLSIIDSGSGPMLHGHSNVVPESYLLFDGLSDGQYAGMPVANKLPVDCNATFAYQSQFFKYPFRGKLKTFDEWYIEGEIIPSTIDLQLQLNYDFQGATQQVTRIVDGSDQSILEGALIGGSLGQKSLGSNPIGGLLSAPADARKFRVTFEFAREDFHEIQDSYSSNEVDRYWAIIARGPNVQLSSRRDTTIRK